MKKIFVVLATKNESDIIESFCRYNLTFCDGMIIYERQSSDNTNEIIKKLIAEGLPIYLYDDPDIVLEPFAEGNVSTAMAYRAVYEYDADLVVPLDTDEFLYHIDGINPRETLEALHEDVEYQIPWRTYVYEKEPDIELGFMPNNFTQYRNPVLEEIQGHAGTTFISKYLIQEKNAQFIGGAHWLVYPEENKNTIIIENPEKLVCAHFPIRSKERLMKKIIPNWIYHWHKSSGFPYHFFDGLHQLGLLFNELEDNGELSQEKIKDYCIEYSLCNPVNNLSKDNLEKIKKKLGDNLLVNDKLKLSFCADKLILHYTKYEKDNKSFIRAITTQIDKTVVYLATEIDEKSRLLEETKAKARVERDGLIAERDGLIAERDGLLNSRSWRITKPLRNFTAFVRRHKVLYLFAKGLFFLKRSVTNKIIKYKPKQTHKELSKFIVLSRSEKLSQKKTIFPKQIKISIITPLYNTPEKFLKEMIQSVKKQTYSNWELCLADGSDDKHKETSRICNSFARMDKRIKYKKLNTNLGISENSNKALDMSTGEYIGILDHDDVLHPSAIYEVIKAICNEDADFIYTDEATFNNYDYKITVKHYKPDFAIDTLRSCNYICHFTVFSRKIVDRVGKFKSEYDGSQDYDLFLRYTDVAAKIYHIPQLLYFWRGHENSASANIGSKSYAIEAGKNAIRDHLIKHGIFAKIESIEICKTIYRINYDLIEHPLVSIIIPNKDHVSLLQSCLSSIKEKTTYNNYEIIIVENNSIENATFTYYEKLKKQRNIKVVYWEEKGFNYSKINNYGVQYAHGQHLVFLNNDVKIITPNWIEEMLMYSQRSDVGAVGAKLYFPDDTIQHAGVIIGMWEGTAGHIFSSASRDNIGYMGKLHFVQNMSAVTAACMMIKKTIFDEVGGFSPEFYASYNDVDLCLKIRVAGYLIVWTPFAEAYHYESKTRGYYNTPEKQLEFSKEIDKFKTKWSKELAAGDPYYNCNLSLNRDDYSEK